MIRISVEVRLNEKTFESLKQWWISSGFPMKTFGINHAVEKIVEKKLYEIEQKLPGNGGIKMGKRRGRAGKHRL